MWERFMRNGKSPLNRKIDEYIALNPRKDAKENKTQSFLSAFCI